jgi:hypothetical protein
VATALYEMSALESIWKSVRLAGRTIVSIFRMLVVAPAGRPTATMSIAADPGDGGVIWRLYS